MAAMVSAWSTKPGAWALDSEQNESELHHHQQQQQQQAASSADFPTLATAAATKPKKKKSQPLSLSQFNSDSFSSKSSSLTPDDLLILPTGPRQRSPEELDRSRLGGGFRSYGGYGDDSSRRQGGGFGLGRDRDRDRDSSSRDPLPPSRADEAPDWGANKRLSSIGSFERRDRDRERGGFFGSSKADEVDNWASGKSSAEMRGLNGGRGWSRSGYEGLSNGNGADGDRWGRKREEDGEVNTGNTGRPRLVLQPRSVPLEEGNVNNNNNKGSGKGSISPFGDARPREEVLKEKGKDWKEMEEKLDGVKIKDGSSEDKWEKREYKGGSSRIQQEDSVSERSWRKAATAADCNVADADRLVFPLDAFCAYGEAYWDLRLGFACLLVGMGFGFVDICI